MRDFALEVDFSKWQFLVAGDEHRAQIIELRTQDLMK